MKRSPLLLIAAVSIALFVFCADCRAAVDYAATADRIGSTLDRAYDSSGMAPGKAKIQASDAYFDLFEGSGFEDALGAAYPSKKTEIELLFGRIITGLGSGAKPEKVRASIDELKGKLRLDAVLLERGNPGRMSMLLNSAIIILREGFEAILIISALAAYLIKSGEKGKVWIVYSGAMVAVAASLAFAALFNVIFPSAGNGRETLEGATMLLAAGVLFYVSYWLISKANAARWQNYIRSAIDDALDSGKTYSLWLASFLAVFREGAETVLFYQALYSSSNGWSSYILGGVVLGALALAAIYLAFRYWIVRIPTGLFFAVTGAFLYYMAFSFSGQGILELQGTGLISSTPVQGLPAVALLGIYPSWEGLSVQILLILAMLAAVVYALFLKQQAAMKKERVR